MTDTMVSEVTKGGVQTKDGTLLKSDLTLWAAGVKGADFLTTLDGLSCPEQ